MTALERAVLRLMAPPEHVPPDSARNDRVALGIAIVVLLTLAALCSIIPSVLPR